MLVRWASGSSAGVCGLEPVDHREVEFTRAEPAQRAGWVELLERSDVFDESLDRNDALAGASDERDGLAAGDLARRQALTALAPYRGEATS